MKELNWHRKKRSECYVDEWHVRAWLRLIRWNEELDEQLKDWLYDKKYDVDGRFDRNTIQSQPHL